MTNEILVFWLICGGVAVAALLLCRRWAHWAVAIVPLTSFVPLALAASVGPEGPRFASVAEWDAYTACAAVFAANVIGLALGKYRFVFFTLFPGRGPDPGRAWEERKKRLFGE